MAVREADVDEHDQCRLDAVLDAFISTHWLVIPKGLGRLFAQRRGGRTVVTYGPDRICVTDAALANLKPSIGHTGDGILTIHDMRGDVSYGLCEHDALVGYWVGVRSP